MNTWRAVCLWALTRAEKAANDDAAGHALPQGMTVLLRIASREQGLVSALASELSVSPAVLQAAAEQALLQTCLQAAGSPARVLALPEQADEALAKVHYRLYMKWLHPDRNPWAHASAERVNQAWQAWQATMSGSGPAYGLAPAVATERSGRRLVLFLSTTALAIAGFVLFDVTADDDLGVDSNAQTANPAVLPTMPTNTLATVAWPAITTEPDEAAQTPVAPPIPSRFAAAVQPTAKVAAPSSHLAPVSVPVSVKPVPARSQTAALQMPSAESVAPEALPEALPLPERELAVLAEFSRCYGAGDLDAMMRLFAGTQHLPEATRASIASDYRRLFDKTHSRSLRFTRMQWQNSEHSATVHAAYVADIRPSRWRPLRQEQGTLVFELHREQGQSRIARLTLER